MKTTQRHDDGFTLVELLVSLALLSLMTIYALTALSSLRDINRVVDHIGAEMEVEAVARHFRETMADTRPVFVMNDNNAPQLLFTGTHETLEFVSASNGDRETGGLYLVRYSVDAEGTLLSERRLFGGTQATEASKVVLLRNVKSVTFNYSGIDAASSETGTFETWQSKNQLPSAIEVMVRFQDADLRKWPPTLVALRTAQ